MREQCIILREQMSSATDERPENVYGDESDYSYDDEEDDDED